MNFYIGNSIKDIIITNDNVEFSDELLSYICGLSKQSLYDMSELYKINPYDDVEIPKLDLSRIIEICNYVLKESLLDSYREPDEGSEMLINLINIAEKALKQDSGLLSIGD